VKSKRLNLIFHLALLILAAFLFVLPSAFAQETPAPDTPAATQEPTTEPAVDTVTTTTTTTTSPVESIGATLTWALGVLALWQAAGIAYAVSVEKSIKPILYGIVSQFTESVQARNAALIVAVFIGAFYAVQAGGINLFVDAPFGVFDNATPAFLLVLNSVFVAAGAFMGHEIWQTLESWLKKAKAVTDVVRQDVSDRSRDRTPTESARSLSAEGVNRTHYPPTKSLGPNDL